MSKFSTHCQQRLEEDGKDCIFMPFVHHSLYLLLLDSYNNQLGE